MIQKYYSELITGDIIFDSYLCDQVKMILKNKETHSGFCGDKVYFITLFDFETSHIEECEIYPCQYVVVLK